MADVQTEVPRGSGGFVRRAVRRLAVIGAIGGAVIVALRKLQGGNGPD